MALVNRAMDNSHPRTESGASESFTVAAETKVFSTEFLRLELHLSEPHDPAKMEGIINYEVVIQISEAYKYKEDSQFLLVVIAGTKNEAILETKRLIMSELHLGVDIFNLSLAGTFADDQTERSVLFKYAGKSIIITGNSFRYFGPSTHYNWDLIDPQELLFLSMNHTDFLFCEVLGQKAQGALTKWTNMLSYSIGPDVDTVDTLAQHKHGRTLVLSLHTESPAGSFNLELKNQYLLNKNDRVL
jgi:hypothetical protein